MIQASVKASDEPIYLRPSLKKKSEAMDNLFACSREGRLRKPFKDLTDCVYLSSTPLIRECFDWMKFSSQELFSLPRDLRAGGIFVGGRKRHLLPGKEYYAVVYEYISNDMPPLDNGAMQGVFDFFWFTGFTFLDLRPENWLGGIILDMASFISPISGGWSPHGRERVDVSSWPKNCFHGPALVEGSLHKP